MKPSSRAIPLLAGLCVVLAGLQTQSANAQDVKQQVTPCTACHLMSDVPATSTNPIIWGQNSGYIYVQLRDFKRRTRASESDAVMHAVTQVMTDAQMLEIAQYVSTRPWPKFQNRASPPTDPLLRRGAELVSYGVCGDCHFNNWQGYSATPRLRGQTPAYLTMTINEFRSGKRGNSPGMADFLRIYDKSDIAAIVAYLSSAD